MKIEVKLFKEDKDSTLSRVYIDNKFCFYSIEDEKRDIKVKGETRVPAGIRNLSLRDSPKFSKEYLVNPDGSFKIVRTKNATPEQLKTWKPHKLIWVLDVPNFEYVLIHWGNTDDDTDGCLIIGDSVGIIKGQNAVLNSRICYKKWYPIMAKEISKLHSTIEYIR